MIRKMTILLALMLVIILTSCATIGNRNAQENETRSMRPNLRLMFLSNGTVCTPQPDLEELYKYINRLEWIADTKIFKGE